MKHIVRRTFVPVLAFALLFPAFGVGAAAGPDPQPVAGPDAKSVVASQGGASVTLADVDAFAQKIPEANRAHFFDNPQRIQTMLLNMLLQKQLAAEAREAGLASDPSVVAAGDANKEAALATAETARYKADLKLPDFEQLAKERYLANPEAFRTPEVLSVKNLLISTKARSEADAAELMQKVEAELKADPSQFDALIAKYSDDPGKSTNGGLVKNAADPRYGDAFTAAARELAKPGDVSPVVKGKYGLSILKLVEKAPAQQKSFADIHDSLIESLRATFIGSAIKERTDILRNKPIDANPDLVASLRTRYGVTPEVPKPQPQPVPKS